MVADGQYASKGDVIFQLVPRNSQANVEARFTYRQFADVRPGTAVNFQVAGDDELRSGKIVSSTSLNSADLSSDIRVQIKPDAPWTAPSPAARWKSAATVVRPSTG